MKYISSTENKQIKLAVKLGERKARDRENLFLVEGKKLVYEALKHPELIYSLFIDEQLEIDYKDIIDKNNNLECYYINNRLMKHICHTETPQGIAAIVKKPEWDFTSLVNEESLMVLLDQISDPGNMGTIIRTSWALDVNGILLTKGCVDPFAPKVVRATMGGIFNIPVFNNISMEKINILKKKNYKFMCADLKGKSNYFDLDFSGRKVIVIGNEANGVSDAIKNICDNFFIIPIKASADSLNAAIACAIITEEAYRQRCTSSFLS